MNLRSLSLLAVVSLLLAACGERHTYRIAPHLQPRYTLALHLGLAGEELGEDGKPVPGSFVPICLTGYAFEWGVTQVVEARERTVLNPPEDGCSVEYVVTQVLSRERVASGTPFELDFRDWSEDYVLEPSRKFVEKTERGVRVSSQAEFTCANDSLCEAIEERAGRGEDFVLECQHSALGELPVITGLR